MAIILTRPNSSIAKLFANSHPITDHASGPCEVPSCRKTPGVRNAPVIFRRHQWTGENNVFTGSEKEVWGNKVLDHIALPLGRNANVFPAVHVDFSMYRGDLFHQ